MGCHFLLQRTFPTQGSNPGFLRLQHRQVDSLPLHHLGSLSIWVTIGTQILFHSVLAGEGLIFHLPCCCCSVASVVSDSVRPHRRQPTRLPHPWDSPGKNTGVGCHFLLQCMKGKSESEVAQSCLTLSDPVDCSLPGSSVHGIFQARVLEWVAIAFSVHLP